MKKKRKISRFGVAALIILFGLCICLVPIFSDRYHSWKYQREIAAWEATRQKEDYSGLWTQAEAYNQRLAKNQGSLALSEEERAYVSTLLNPLENGMMGYVDVPKIDVHLPIYQGTEETELQSGCGWWYGTSLPTGGESTHCVITAHNGLAKAKMFTDLDRLALGDTFQLTILDRVMVYEVDQILTTLPEEYAPLKILPGEDFVTLYTCTPFGVNTHRLLVRGHRIPDIQEPAAEDPVSRSFYLAVISALMLLALILFILRENLRRKPNYRKQHASNAKQKGGKYHGS